MPHQSTGIDIREDRNFELLKIFLSDLLRAPVRAHLRELAHDQSLNVGMGGLVVFRIGAVISDFRSGQNNNLSGIGRVGENFLVTGDGSIKNDFPVAFAFGAVAFASKDAPIFEGKDSLHSCSRVWILESLTRMTRSTKRSECLRNRFLCNLCGNLRRTRNR